VSFRGERAGDKEEKEKEEDINMSIKWPFFMLC